MSDEKDLPGSAVGLLAAGNPVPLEGVSVEASVQEFCARVTVSQRYRNTESKPIEAVYVFPLDEAAALCGFEAVIDGVHVVAEVKEREQAFAEYDDALAAGHGAYLLDQERPDVFTASIGNLPPGKEVLVRLSYVTELERQGRGLRFVLPTTVSPRYAPAEDRVGVGRTPAEALNPPVAWSVPYGLELRVDIEAASAIQGVESPTHPISVELQGARGTVRLGRRETALDRDLVLDVSLAEPEKPRVWVEVDEAGRRAAALVFGPEFESEESPSEILFIVDRSGSMEGTSIAEAKNALQLCLRSLTSGTRFNIVGFGSKYELLFPESRPYDEKSLAEASAHLRSLRADLGGTEILAPLTAVLEKELLPGLPRQLFVLTDGQVTNTEAVIQLIRRHSETTRVFTFGIGAGASRHLVRGMARAGGGAAEFISPGERIEGKVVRQLGKALAPALTEVKLDWGRLRVQQAPYAVPPVFAGGRVLVYGLLEDATAGEVTLSARGPKGRLSFSLRVDPEYAQRGNLVGTLAARTMIRDLEEGMSRLHDRRGSRQERVTADRVKEEIVRLGLAYGLASRETSFVAVERRESPVPGEMELRRVPIALTHGWGGWGETRVGSSGMVFGAARMAPTAATAAFAPRMARSAVSRLKDTVWGAGVPPSAPDEEMFELALPLESSRLRPLDRLVALQRADGSWELTQELADVLGTRLAELESGIARASGDRDEIRRAWATALALIWLKIEASNEVGEWLLLENKARQWLSGCKARPAAGEWLEQAAAFFSKS
jgi:hypothetical protein